MRELKPKRNGNNNDSSFGSETEMRSSNVNMMEMEDETYSKSSSSTYSSYRPKTTADIVNEIGKNENMLMEKQTLESAQSAFKEAVSEELEKLEKMGKDRSVAVVILLQRIAGNPKLVTPKQEEVEKVIKLYGLSEEDAVRALIVKEELRRLKKGGMDGLAAVEELTRKMRNGNSSNTGSSSSSSGSVSKADVENMTSGSGSPTREHAHTHSSRKQTQIQQQQVSNRNNSRKRCIGDESISAVVLKRLRRFAMKDTSNTNTSNINTIPNASEKEKQVKDVAECNTNALSAKSDSLTVTPATVKHSQQQPLCASRKRNLKVTQSPNKRSRKSKL